MERNWDVDVRDGGYVRGGVGGGLILGVEGSSFFISNLFTLNPAPQYSTKQFPNFHLLFYFFYVQSITLFLIA